MKCVSNAKLICVLVLTGLLWAVVWGGDPAGSYEETVIVSCLPGDQPGQYFYARAGGHNEFPRCFAIDPNERAFYVPEVHPYTHAIRIHKFDETGKFVATVSLADKASMVLNIAVGLRGEMYLVLQQPEAGYYVRRYNKKGKLLNGFGPKGPIRQEDSKPGEETNQTHEQHRSRDKYFSGPAHLFILPDDDLLVVRSYDLEEPDTFKFCGRTGHVLAHSKGSVKLPAQIAKTRADYLEKRETFHKLNKTEISQGTKRVGYGLIGPDGQFYYMCVTPEKFEIRKVLFHEDAATAEDSGQKTE